MKHKVDKIVETRLLRKKINFLTLHFKAVNFKSKYRGSLELHIKRKYACKNWRKETTKKTNCILD